MATWLILGYVGMFSNVIEITPPLTINQEYVNILEQALEKLVVEWKNQNRQMAIHHPTSSLMKP
jgi:4-aminobutyrate aminotransferase-like enzyme